MLFTVIGDKVEELRLLLLLEDVVVGVVVEDVVEDVARDVLGEITVGGISEVGGI